MGGEALAVLFIYIIIIIAIFNVTNLLVYITTDITFFSFNYGSSSRAKKKLCLFFCGVGDSAMLVTSSSSSCNAVMEVELLKTVIVVVVVAAVVGVAVVEQRQPKDMVRSVLTASPPCLPCVTPHFAFLPPSPHLTRDFIAN